MGAKVLMAKSDSLLVTGQVTGEFQVKDLQMAAYLEYAQELKRSFVLFEVVHVPMEQNARADLLAKLASSGKGGRQRTVIQETLKTPRAFVVDHQVLQVCKSIEGTTRSHRSLTQETLRTPRVRARLVGETKMTQVCAIHEPNTWIMPYQRYIVYGVLPMDPTEARKIKKNSSRFTLIDGELYRQMKYLVVAIEYFTKWIEAELVAQITVHKIQSFVWKNIVCRFGVPKRLVSDNGTQFASHLLKKLCGDVGIQQVFASVESANRVLLRGLKRRLEKAKGSWAEEVPRIVWAYHTTEQSGTHETPFSLVYGCDAMIPVETQESSPRFQNFVAEDSNEERRMNLDLLDQVREEARVKAEAVKRKVERKYNSRIRPRQFRDGALVMRKAHHYEMENKLSPKWTGPFRTCPSAESSSSSVTTTTLFPLSRGAEGAAASASARGMAAMGRGELGGWWKEVWTGGVDGVVAD
ncbi:uncharacterized protein [Phaseolus vulgaris]|uniref:uncharacterized protein n=1 Tax=Phaseolus vulgaris TaxID=3885 RepID=UPI0035CADCDF